VTDKSDLVERRQKYIERHIQLDTRAVNVRFTGQRPEGSGPANRHGMPKLPVGQREPKLYAWKGAKWIRKIEFLAEDRKGFWEVRGYSNSAEPWFNDRYATD
jgi:hypothetical protein